MIKFLGKIDWDAVATVGVMLLIIGFISCCTYAGIHESKARQDNAQHNEIMRQKYIKIKSVMFQKYKEKNNCKVNEMSKDFTVLSWKCDNDIIILQDMPKVNSSKSCCRNNHSDTSQDDNVMMGVYGAVALY